MKNIELLENLLRLREVQQSEAKLDINAAYNVAANIHTIDAALKPYLEEREKIENKYKLDSDMDREALSQDEDLRRLGEIEVDVSIRKIKLASLPKELSVKDATALFFMIEE